MNDVHSGGEVYLFLSIIIHNPEKVFVPGGIPSHSF